MIYAEYIMKLIEFDEKITKIVINRHQTKDPVKLLKSQHKSRLNPLY